MAEDVGDLGVGSHVPILAAAVVRTSGPVLECGMGKWSSHMLHLMCRGRYLRSLETSQDWLERFTDYRSPLHEVSLVSYWREARLEDKHWSVAFVDHAPGEERPDTILRLKDHADFIVVHDWCADRPGSGGNYGWKKLEGVFKYVVEYERTRPVTAILSDVEAFVI